MWVACAVLAPLTGCSILLDWSSYTPGAEGDAGAPETSVPGTSCGSNLRCIAVAPVGWSGPSALYEGDVSAAPECGVDATMLYAGKLALSASPASCAPCNCAAPRGAPCNPPAVTGYSDSSCSTPSGPANPLNVNDCVAPDPSSVAYTVSAAAPAGGTCAASGGAPNVAAPAWGEAVVACEPNAADRGSCDTGQICVPAPTKPFRPQFCIQQSGIAKSCPAGTPFTSGPTVAYATVSDTRGCTRCACGPIKDAKCFSGPIFRFNGLNCPITLSTDLGGLPAGCSPTSGSISFKATISGPVPTPTPGSCDPAGGEPSGQLTPDDPTSFCCTP